MAISDERSTAVCDAYDQWAATYDLDANKTRDLDEQVVRERLAGESCQVLIELGCGTGKNTGLYASISRQVIAIDASSGMLNVARARIGSNPVQFFQADISRNWPLVSGSADWVVANLVLEHLPDLAPVFAETFRVLRPGGRFFISELHPYRQYRGVTARFEREGLITRIDGYVHHVSDFAGAARQHGMQLMELDERFDDGDRLKIPRLITFVFERNGEPQSSE